MNKKLLLLLCTTTAICLASENSVYSCLGNTPTVAVGYCSTANNKPQEDMFTIASFKKDKEDKPCDFFGIYDGHATDQVACYLANNLHTKFEENLHVCATTKEAFERAFKHVEEHSLASLKGGSTAIAACIDSKENMLHVAWVGDSRLVLEKNGKKYCSTRDHVLKREDEEKRVKDAGGIFFRDIIKATPKMEAKAGRWRINGLEMTRVIGDKWCKGRENTCDSTKVFSQPARRVSDKEVYFQLFDESIPSELVLKPLEGQVIADPEYGELSLENSRWLILASDGLWDVVSSKEAVDFVIKNAQEGASLNGIAKMLVDVAIANRSKDNITVIVVDLLSKVATQ